MKNMNKHIAILATSLILGLAAITPAIALNDSSEKVEAGTQVFFDDFSSYSTYDNMKGNWSNGYFYYDDTHKLDQESCSPTYNSIGQVDATYGKSYHVDTFTNKTDFNYVTIAGQTPVRYELSYSFYYDHPLSLDEGNNPWFGICAHKIDSSYNPRDSRYTDVNCALITIEVESDTTGDYRPYKNAYKPSDMVDTQLGGSFTGDNCMKFSIPIRQWHVAKFKCDMNKSGLAIYTLDIDGEEVGRSMCDQALFNSAGSISIATTYMNMYIDNVKLVSFDSDPMADKPSIDNATFTRFTGTEYPLNVNFNSSEVISLFDGNGKVVPSAKYEIDYLNGKIYLNKDYVNSVDCGAHTYALSTTGGKSEFTLTIQDPNNPPTIEGGNTRNYMQGGTNDLVLNVDLHGIPLKNFTYGESGSMKGKYTYDNGVLTISNAFLEGVNPGENKFNIVSYGGTTTLTVNVSEQVVIEPPVTLTPSLKYVYQGGYTLDAKVDFKKLPIQSIVIEGESKTLVENTDYIKGNNSITLTSTLLDSLTVTTHKFVVTTEGGSCNFNVVVSEEAGDTKEAPVLLTSEMQYTLGDEDNLYVPVDFKEEALTSLTLDGNEIDKANYSYSIGDSNITLYNAYLESLSAKTNPYSLAISTEGGTVVLSLTVKKPTTPVGPDYNEPIVISSETKSYFINCGENLEVAVEFDHAPLISLSCDSDVLEEDTDFNYSNELIIIKCSYLDALNNGDHTFEIETEGGETSFVVNVSVKPITHEAPLIAGRDLTFNVKEETQLIVVCDLRGEDIMSLTTGSKSLQENTDYTLDNNDPLILIKKSFLSTLPSGKNSFTVTTVGGSAYFDVTIQTVEAPSVESSEIQAPLNGTCQIYVHAHGGAINSVADDYGNLIKDVDYIVNGETITITNDYLSYYNAGDVVNIKITTDGGTVRCSLNIVQSIRANINIPLIVGIAVGGCVAIGITLLIIRAVNKRKKYSL